MYKYVKITNEVEHVDCYFYLIKHVTYDFSFDEVDIVAISRLDGSRQYPIIVHNYRTDEIYMRDGPDVVKLSIEELVKGFMDRPEFTKYENPTRGLTFYYQHSNLNIERREDKSGFYTIARDVETGIEIKPYSIWDSDNQEFWMDEFDDDYNDVPVKIILEKHIKSIVADINRNAI